MEQEVKKDSLFTLLTSLEKSDQGLIEFDPEKHREILLKAEVKIDAYKFIMMKYESRITEIDNEINELTQIKKTLENRIGGIRSLILWIMKEKGLDKFPGVKYVAKLMERKKISITAEPNAGAYFEFPDLVRRSYSWDKTAFNKMFNSDPRLALYAKEEVNQYIRFDLKRTIDE